MKKLGIILGLLTLVSTTSAQSWFGIKAGLNIERYVQTVETHSGLEGDYHASVHWDGFHIGIFGKFRQRCGVWGFQPELLYSQSSREHCGIIPLNLLWEPFGDSPVGIYALAGPYGQFHKYYSKNLTPLYGRHNDFVWGFGIGGGLRILHLQIEGKWNWNAECWQQNQCFLSVAVLF
ncbi:MAG: hypothetical protein LBG52_01005 [Candidatus Peribacteria bacterium]|jgi:hypothetical protein|nr:hypothetical protein [Candidatus Peribacteria bacterium]